MKSMHYWIIQIILKKRKKLIGKNKEKIKAEIERLKRNISQTYMTFIHPQIVFRIKLWNAYIKKKIPIRL